MKKMMLWCLTVGLLVFFVSSAFAFTVGRSDRLGEDHILLRKQFLNQNVYPYRVDWVQIRINFIPPRIKMQSEEEKFSGNIYRKYEKTIQSFLIVMENDDWLRAGYFQVGQSSVPDGWIGLDKYYDPKFVLSLGGREKVIYFNPKMSFEEYFIVVNQKIHRRLSNKDYLPYQGAPPGDVRMDTRHHSSPMHRR